MEARVIEKDYISKNIFDLHMQNMKEKAKSDEKMNDMRFTSLEKMVSDNFDKLQTTIEGVYEKLGAKIEIQNERLNSLEGQQAKINEKLEKVVDAEKEITGDVKALNATVSTLQTKIGWWITLLGIFVGVALAVFQIWK